METVYDAVKKTLGTHTERADNAKKAGHVYRHGRHSNVDPAIAERAAQLQAKKSYDDLVASITADVCKRLKIKPPAERGSARKILEVK